MKHLITEHFYYEDCSCRHCGELLIIPLLYTTMELYEKLRVKCGFPILFNDGHRCSVHNKAVGGEIHISGILGSGEPDSGSLHLLFAIDSRPERLFNDTDETVNEKLQTMFDVAEEVGFTGIGTYDDFMHTDCRPNRARWKG